MAFTKVVGPGIHTLSNILSHNINSSGIITATKFVGPFDNATIGGGTTISSDGINVTGIVTATQLDINGNGDISGNLVLGGDLTVNGTTTTLDTNLIGVDRIEVLTAGTNVAVAVTHNGSGDLIRLYDGTSQVVTVDDEGNVGIGTNTLFTGGAHSGTHQLTITNNNPSMSLGVSNTDQLYVRREQTNGKYTFQTNQSGGNNGVISLQPYGGNVGIGSATPLSAMALDVVGSIRYSNQSRGANGTNAEPSYAFYSDHDSGMYRGGTNILSFATAGIKRVTVLADGKVGIGSGTPSGLLDVNKGTQANIQIKTTDSGSINSMVFSIGSSTNQIYSRGANSATARNLIFLQGSTEVLKIDTAGNLVLRDTVAQGNSLVNYIQANDVNGAAQYILGQVSTGNQDLYLVQSKEANLRFQTNGATRWKIDGNPGHLLPETAGAVNIGSATAEIGHVYLADDKRLQLGSDQDMLVYHDDTHGYVSNRKNNLYLQAPTYVMITSTDTSGSNMQTGARFLRGGSAEIYHSNSLKFETTGIGVSVHGEVAASQEYPDIQPTFDANFAASRTLDPRFTFQRVGPTSFVNESGKVVLVGENVPRFDHNPTTRESLGILIEEARTNSWTYSQPTSSAVFGANGTFTYEAATAPNGKTEAFRLANNPAGSSNSYHRATRAITFGSDAMVLSVWAKGENNNNYFIWSFQNLGGAIVRAGFKLEGDGETSIVTNGNGGHTLQIQKYPDGWYRCIIIANTQSSGSTTQFLYTASGYSESSSATGGSTLLWGFQLEVGSFATSYIPTSSAAVTRGADLLRIMDDEFKDIFGDEFREFTIVADYDNSDTVDGSIQALVDFWGESTGYTDRIEIFKDGDSPYNIEVRGIANNAGLFANGVANASSKALTQRFATSWSVDYTTTNAANRKWAFSFSGEAVDVIGDLTGTDVPAITRLGLGNTPTRLDLSPGKLHFKRFTFYPKAVSDQQLINLSTP